MNHFNVKEINFSEIQKAVIEEILKEQRRKEIIKSDEEYNAQLASWLDRISSNSMTLRVRNQEGLSNPRDFNDVQEEIMMDIMTAFSHINHVDEAIIKHQQLNQSVINNLQLTLSKTSDELTKYERLVDYMTSENVAIETFRDVNSFATDVDLYRDRGIAYTIDYQATLDINREGVKLPALVSQDCVIGPGGVRLATVEKGKQLGGGLIRFDNPEYKIEKVFDDSNETFWSESIMVDSPINVSLGKQFYDIEHGAVCELFINFDSATQLNEVILSAFSEFPMEIVAIQYFETDDDSEKAKELIAPGFKDGLNSRTLSTTTSYQFEDIYAKRLRLIVNQIHYVKSNYILNRREQEQLELWHKSKLEGDPEEAPTRDDFIFKPIYKNRYESNPIYPYFEERLKEMEMDLETVYSKRAGNIITASTKYIYNYGLYKVGIKKNEYQNIGIYISNPLEINSVIKAVTLDVWEEHPVLSNDDARFTDIEYFISHMENPADDDWYPIFPINQEKVLCEALQLEYKDGVYKAPLRFPTLLNTEIVIKKNGVKLHEALGQFSINSNDEVTIPAYDASVTYTAEYTPDPSASTIDYVDMHTINGVVQPNMKVEEKKGTTPLGELQLSYYPFVDKEKLNAQSVIWDPRYLANDFIPIQVKFIEESGFHIDQPYDVNETDAITIVNKTDYFNSEDSLLDPFDEETKNYQYVVEGNKLLFNTVIPETTRIIITYPYLVGSMRVKAVLRRNVQGYNGLTPVLEEYMVRYQCLT